MKKYDRVVSDLTFEQLSQQSEDEEFEKRINDVGEYIINNNTSIRKTAKVFKISSTTVFDYCKRYEKMKPERGKLLRAKLENNAEKSIKEKEVQERVLYNTKLILEGLTIEEIVEKTKCGYWTVYRDVTSRLKEIDNALYEEVKLIFKSRSTINLNNQQKK